MKIVRSIGILLLLSIASYQCAAAPRVAVPVQQKIADAIAKSKALAELPQPALGESKTLTVPSPNKFYGTNPYHGAKTIEINDNEPIFLVMVHGTFSSETDSADPEMLYWGEDEFIEKVPKNFFGPNTNPEKTPIRLTFRWSGNLSDDARKKGGKKLGESIAELYAQFPNAYVICAGHSHGGNVINVASQYLNEKQTIDLVIQLATPVLAYNAKKDTFDNATGYYPNSKAIDTLMIFYSEHDFVQSGGASNSSFKRRYAPIAGIDLYNVRLRKLRGVDDLHVHMHDDVIGKKILQLCHKIKSVYKGNKNLIADITPAPRREKFIQERKASFPGMNINEILELPLVCIQPYKGEVSKGFLNSIKSTAKQTFQGRPTDSFWPNWTGKYPSEIEASNKDARIFKDIFGFSMDEKLTPAQRLMSTADEMRKEAGRRLGLN
jgi:hypothetical protein